MQIQITMDSSAFGSPIVVWNVEAGLETELLGIGERIVRRVIRTSLFPEAATHSVHIENQHRTPMLELLSEGGNIVGIGAVDNSIKCGMELNHVKLFPSEVVVRVSHVVDEMVSIGELVGE